MGGAAPKLTSLWADRLANQFDTNKDGVLQGDEALLLRKEMVASTVNRFRELQAAGQVTFFVVHQHLDLPRAGLTSCVDGGIAANRSGGTRR